MQKCHLLGFLVTPLAIGRSSLCGEGPQLSAAKWLQTTLGSAGEPPEDPFTTTGYWSQKQCDKCTYYTNVRSVYSF